MARRPSCYTLLILLSVPVKTGPVMTGDVYVAGFEDAHRELCPQLGSNLQVMIFITSALSHFKQRNAIRTTWGQFNSNTSLAFVIGTPSDSLRSQIEEENEMYGDIIIGRYIDTYRNLTLKSLSMLEWLIKYCPRVPRMLKTDDDMFINVPKLLEFVNNPSQKIKNKTIWGSWHGREPPIRKSTSKFYVSYNQFPGDLYPYYIGGAAYLMTTDVAKDFYAAALKEPYLYPEDIFITGILAGKFRVKLDARWEFFTRKVSNPCEANIVISSHAYNYNQLQNLWKSIKIGTKKCT